MERHFEQQLTKLQKRIIKMGSLVNRQVEDTLKAVKENNREYAKEILAREVKVDKFDDKIKKLCLKLVVLNQPVAMDLRFVFSSITINTSLERIGDLAAKIAKGLEETEYTHAELKMMNFDLLSSTAQEMVNNAIDAFIQRDAKLAKEVLILEERMNDLKISETAHVHKYLRENSKRVDSALFLYDMIHALERIGDHCANIAEDVYFIVEAENIRHFYAEKLFSDDERRD